MTEFAGFHQRIGQRFEIDGGIPVMWGGSSDGKGRATLARIVNLSVTGAGVVADDSSKAEVGDEWELTVGETTATVIVREIRSVETEGSRYYGVEFLAATPDELLTLIDTVITAEDADRAEGVWIQTL